MQLPDDIILIAIGLLAFLSLISASPTKSALFVFLESIILSVFFAWSNIDSAIFPSLLLTFFAVTITGLNYYLGITFQKQKTRIPKLPIIFGALFFVYFFLALTPVPINTIKGHLNLFLLSDGLTLILSGFSLFAMLVCAIFVFEITNKNLDDVS